MAATEDAFDLLDTIGAHRLAKRLTTVIDTLGLDPVRRRGWLEARRATHTATRRAVRGPQVGPR